MMPRSTLRHRPIHEDIPQLAVGELPTTTITTKRHSALILLVLGMIIILLLIWPLQEAWASLQIATLRYGSTPTTQFDHLVGHEVGSTLSHFTAMNVNGQIYVLKIPGGNPAAAHLLAGPRLIGSNADLVPVQLVFVGNKAHPDLMIEVAGIQVSFHNPGKSYEPSHCNS